MTTTNDTRPRVLLIHNFISPYRVPLFRELNQRFDLDIWILGDIAKLREWRGDAPPDAFRYRMLPHVSVGLGSRYNRVLLNPGFSWAFMRHRCDAIICCGWDAPVFFQAACLARLRGLPFVLWAGSTAAENSWYRSVARWPVAQLVQSADAWLAYGSRARDYLVDLGATEERVFRAFNTVEIDDFAQASVRAQDDREALKKSLGVKTPHVILFCGNLLTLKGIDDLIPAFATLRGQREDVSLVLVGSGKAEDRFKELCQREGVDEATVFTGYVPREELPKYYAIADLFVLPSRREVWGLVVNEALACGVPTVVSEAAGASADLIQPGENGYVAPPSNARALAEIFVDYFGDETDRAAMADAARRSIAPFSIAAMGEAFEAAVACAMARRPS
jgi:glycosyltransferase involved in cell wall biosynthesis